MCNQSAATTRCFQRRQLTFRNKAVIGGYGGVELYKPIRSVVEDSSGRGPYRQEEGRAFDSLQMPLTACPPQQAGLINGLPIQASDGTQTPRNGVLEQTRLKLKINKYENAQGFKRRGATGDGTKVEQSGRMIQHCREGTDRLTARVTVCITSKRGKHDLNVLQTCPSVAFCLRSPSQSFCFSLCYVH